MSGYNVRDFFMTLEHLTTVCSGSITKEVIEENFGNVYIMDGILDALCSADYEKAVEEYENYSSYEIDFDMFISRFLDYIIERLRMYLRKGGEEVFLYASIVKIIYKFLQNRVKLKGVVAAKVLFFEIVSQITKGDFGLKRLSKTEKLIDGEEIFNLLTTKDK
jgi:DNA polymerase III gamma/tau subunit